MQCFVHMHAALIRTCMHALWLEDNCSHPCRMDGAVVYIDTELKFTERRLVQIMEQRIRVNSPPSAASPSEALLQQKQHVEALSKRVHIIRPRTGDRFCISLVLSGSMHVSGAMLGMACLL